MTDGDWKIFIGSGKPHDGINRLPNPPPWRPFDTPVLKERQWPRNEEEDRLHSTERGRTFQADLRMVEAVNAALYLRRPLLITGKPGSGKSSLIEAVAFELRLGRVLRWPITSRSNLQQGLYHYDPIGRLQEAQLTKATPHIGNYLRLGPLGTALLPTGRPRALLIDEIDKADIDLPSDLLNVFEEGEFPIPELERLDIAEPVQIRAYSEEESFPITCGRVRCHQFPLVVLTSNGERDFPLPFLRRCLRLEVPDPDFALLAKIVASHLGENIANQANSVIDDFGKRRKGGELATDQLLNAVYLVIGRQDIPAEERQRLADLLLKELAAARLG
ncbi:MAG: AAA family ATPase [Candidatus Competibacteraceae bacterium]|nr:AAA family ATPase [Candidatus Competibacteraceae bacterium]MCP5451511.1 AAA family ATPase [Gammaproteobacteria bacterium]HRX63231.1 MoxR family ATPase [Candidatus Competibacter sp.]